MSKAKDRTKRAYLSQSQAPRLRTILDPRILPEIGYGQNKRAIRLSDYIAVPAVSTHGTWNTKDLIPVGQLAELKRFTNSLAR